MTEERQVQLRLIGSKATPVLSWGSAIAIIGMLMTGTFPGHDVDARMQASADLVQSDHQQLQEVAKTQSTQSADIEGLKHDSENYKQDVTEIRQQLTNLGYKQDRMLELMLQQKNDRGGGR